MHDRVVRRLLAEGLTPVLDMGCGEGELARHLPDGAWIGLDNSPAMLARAPSPNVVGDATALSFPDRSFDFSRAALRPLPPVRSRPRARRGAARAALGRTRRAVAAPSRHDSPELADVLPDEPLTFDAELAPSSSLGCSRTCRVERWDAQLLELPSRPAVRDYLIGKGTNPETARAAAEIAGVPLSVTKRGALAFARRR